VDTKLEKNSFASALEKKREKKAKTKGSAGRKKKKGAERAADTIDLGSGKKKTRVRGRRKCLIPFPKKGGLLRGGKSDCKKGKFAQRAANVPRRGMARPEEDLGRRKE